MKTLIIPFRWIGHFSTPCTLIHDGITAISLTFDSSKFVSAIQALQQFKLEYDLQADVTSLFTVEYLGKNGEVHKPSKHGYWTIHIRAEAGQTQPFIDFRSESMFTQDDYCTYRYWLGDSEIPWSVYTQVQQGAHHA